MGEVSEKGVLGSGPDRDSPAHARCRSVLVGLWVGHSRAGKDNATGSRPIECRGTGAVHPPEGAPLLRESLLLALLEEPPSDLPWHQGPRSTTRKLGHDFALEWPRSGGWRCPRRPCDPVEWLAQAVAVSPHGSPSRTHRHGGVEPSLALAGGIRVRGKPLFFRSHQSAHGSGAFVEYAHSTLP